MGKSTLKGINNSTGQIETINIYDLQASNNNKAEIDINKTTIAEEKAKLNALIANQAGQNNYDQATTQTLQINDETFTDVSLYDFTDNSNTINDWQDKLVRIVGRITSDGTQEYTMRLEIEYDGVRKVVREQLVSSANLEFFTRNFNLIYSQDEWNAFDDQEKDDEIANNSNLPYDIKLYLTAQTGNVLANNPNNNVSGGTLVYDTERDIVPQSYTQNLFYLNDNYSVDTDGAYTTWTIEKKSTGVQYTYNVDFNNYTGTMAIPEIEAGVFTRWAKYTSGTELSVYIASSDYRLIKIEASDTPPTTYKTPTTRLANYNLSSVVMEIVDRNAVLANIPGQIAQGDAANKALIDNKVKSIAEDGTETIANIIETTSVAYDNMTHNPNTIYILSDTFEFRKGDDLAKK